MHIVTFTSTRIEQKGDTGGYGVGEGLLEVLGVMKRLLALVFY